MAYSIPISNDTTYIRISDRYGFSCGNQCTDPYDLADDPFTLSLEFSAYAQITTSSAMICVDETLNFSASDDLASIWSWEFGAGAIPPTSEDQNPQDILFSEPGEFEIVLTANGCSTDTVFLSVLPETMTPMITQNGAILTSSSEAGNQWHLNGEAIENATGQQYQPIENGVYIVCVASDLSCGEACSEEFNLTNVSISEYEVDDLILMHPNPAQATLHITTKSNIELVQIFDLSGKSILMQEVTATNTQTILNVSQLASGVYFCTIQTSNGNFTKRMVKH